MRRFAAAVLYLAAAASVASADTRYDFNPGWRLLVGDARGAEAAGFDDSSWKGGDAAAALERG